MAAMDMNSPEVETPPEPGSIGAGADIYRRLERRGRGRPMWMTALPIVGVVALAAGGVVAYEAMQPRAAAKPAAAQPTLPPVALAPVAAVPSKPAQVATATPPAPTPAAQAPATAAPAPARERVRAVRPEHSAPVMTRASHTTATRHARAASSAGEDTSAYSPAPDQTVTRPPAPMPAAPAPTMAAPPAVSPPPVAVPPVAVSPAAPPASSQAAPTQP